MFGTDANQWKKNRAAYIRAARACRQALTDPNSFWRYDKDDPRVHAAVECWLHRARNAHAFALGRKPVIQNFLYYDGEKVYEGPLYAK